MFSCRHCGRDLTPVLPLLFRISKLEFTVSALETQLKHLATESREPLLLARTDDLPETVVETGRRRYRPLFIGFIALILAYATIVLWLDLSLSVLRFSSIIIPLVTGFLYLGRRPRLTSTDVAIAVLFAIASVLTMSLILGWTDSIPVLPQDTAAWRETMYYMLSIGASMLAGMLLRMMYVGMAVRGFTSLPRLRQGLLTMNKSMPLDTLKAIELTVLLIGTMLSAITGFFAGIMGLSG